MKTEPELYKPAEACKMAEVAPYVLRYWETEFPVLSERKDKGPARLYSGREVRIISRIRELLLRRGLHRRRGQETSRGRGRGGPFRGGARRRTERRRAETSRRIRPLLRRRLEGGQELVATGRDVRPYVPRGASVCRRPPAERPCLPAPISPTASA